jgi:hypothetical protein
MSKLTTNFVGMLFFCVLIPSVAIANCEEFEAEMRGPIGSAIPRIDENGKLRSIVVYGEGTFIAPKRSLISQARVGAELSAKRAFSEWISGANFSAIQEAQQFVEIVELTNQAGETAALAQEITTQLQIMRSDTNSVIDGLIKFDECVDTTQQYILVGMGWSPRISSSVSATSPASASSSNEGHLGSVITDIVPSEGYRITSPLKDQF